MLNPCSWAPLIPRLVAESPATSISKAKIKFSASTLENWKVFCSCNLQSISKNKDELPRNNLAEISGLVISKQSRRRAEDKFIYGPEEERREIIDTGDTKQYQRRAEDKYRSGELYERRRGPDLVLSLYKAIYHESKRRNITHWYAVMTKGLYILLKRFGIDFEPIGQPVDYHGIRTPYLGDIKKI